MNANEFADELEKAPTLWFKDDIAGKWIIEKLRQQQAEIEALKSELDRAVELYTDKAIENEALKKEAALQRLSDFTQEAESFDRTASHMAGEYVSYSVKELTDEEIDNISDEIPHYIDTYMGRRMFARAILIKAQEK